MRKSIGLMLGAAMMAFSSRSSVSPLMAIPSLSKNNVPTHKMNRKSQKWHRKRARQLGHK